MGSAWADQINSHGSLLGKHLLVIIGLFSLEFVQFPHRRILQTSLWGMGVRWGKRGKYLVADVGTGAEGQHPMQCPNNLIVLILAHTSPFSPLG